VTFSEFASRLHVTKNKKFKGGQGVIARCPVCEAKGGDKAGEHLSAFEGDDGWIHVYCVTRACSEDDILRALGLSQEDRQTQAPSDDESCYVYTDTEGRYLFEKRRFTKLDGKKGFVQQVRQRKGIPLAKVQGRGGGLRFPTPTEAGLDEASKVLYRLPGVTRAIAEGRTIYVNEGEKSCDLMWRQGLAATCQPDGAGNGKWHKAHTDALKGAAKVVIVADRDDTGDAYATQVFVSIRAAGIPVEVVRSKTTGEKHDAYDHLSAGHGPEEFVPAMDLMPPRGIKLRTLPDEFQPKAMRYLVEPYLPIGKCVLFDADGGTGKTTMALAWAAALSRGLHPITRERLECGPITTIYLHKSEDTDQELGTVYAANNGDPRRIHFGGDDILFDEAGLCQLRDSILDTGARFIVVDALFYFIQGVVRDASTALDVVAVMQRLNDLAAQTGATFFDIRHTTKGGLDKKASELGMGSVQFRNSHRGQLVARWHPEMRGAVVVTDEKGSLLVPRGDHFVYRRVDLEVQYIRNVPNPFDQKETAEQLSKLAIAEQFLRECLIGQYVPVGQVVDEARALGISKRTVESARAKLGVKAVKPSPAGGWLLHLPKPEGFDPFAEDE